MVVALPLPVLYYIGVLGAGVAVIADTIYVCGGYDGANHLVSVESFNVCTGHWSIVSNMNIPRCYVGACVLKGKLYVVAGSVLLSSQICYVVVYRAYSFAMF